MWNPLNIFFRKHKKEESSTELSNTTGNAESVETVPTDNVEDVEVVSTERERLLSQIDTNKLDSILYKTNYAANNVPIEFLRKLVSQPTLFDYLFNNYFESDIILKIIEGTLRVSDVKENKRELFQYDVFSSEDKNLIEILNKDVEISNQSYAIFSYDEFNSFINSNEYLNDYIEPLIGNEKIFISSIKATLLPNSNIFRSFEDIKIYHPLNQDSIIQRGMFDCYYSDNVEFSKDTIIFISYDEFLEWIKDDEKRKIITKVQVVISDIFNYNKVSELSNQIKIYNSFLRNNFFDTDTNSNAIIQANHLLYIIENSHLNENKKNYYSYLVKTNHLNYTLDKDSWYRYKHIEKLQEISKELEKLIDLDLINENTLEFNKLSLDEKKKGIDKPRFSSKIFLSQFDNLDDISAFALLVHINRLNKEDRKLVFEEQVIIDKLKELLKESDYDEYKGYERFCKVLNEEEVFKIFDANFIEKFYKINREFNQYKLYYSILTYNDVNKGMEIIFKDEKLFKQFLKSMCNLGEPLSKLNYNTTLKLLKKLEIGNYDNVNLTFVSSFDIKYQYNLLKEDFNNDFLVDIVTNSSKEVQQFFYREDVRFTYLWKKFDILRLTQAGYIFNDDVISKNDFFDKFKVKSMITFRSAVNRFLINQPDIYFEEKITKYEDELISNFNINTGLFKQYEWLLENINFLADRSFSYVGIDLFYDANTNYECRKFIARDDEDKIYIKDKEGIVNYLTWLSKAKLNEIIIDRLFKDNIYNVFLNIKEMLRFNEKLNVDEKILDDEKCEFYNTILNIDKLDNNNILEIYNKFKGKNVALMFYEDLRNLKNLSYNKIKEDIIKPEEMNGMEDKELSNKYGVPVFDLRDKEYVILGRCLNGSFYEDTYHRRDCYTLFSNDNSKVLHDDALIYGYSGFDNDCILHVSEADSFSGDIKYDELSVGTNVVNRIMTSREITTNSSWFSEVQIVNKKNPTREGRFEALRPSFLIVYDEINDTVLAEAKRMNIPIYIVSKTLNNELIGDYNPHDALHNDNMKYIDKNGYISNEDKRRRSR